MMPSGTGGRCGSGGGVAIGAEGMGSGSFMMGDNDGTGDGEWGKQI